MRIRTLLPSADAIAVICILVPACVVTGARPALAQDQVDCVLPPGVMPLADPGVTARQVEDGNGSLMDFALAARKRFGIETQEIETLEQALYFGCRVRQEGSPWRSGSTYLVQLMPDGRVLVHAANMALSGRLLNPLIYAEILSALGVEPAVLANLASPDPAAVTRALGAVMGALSQEPDGAFDATTPIPGLRPGIPGASGYAAVYLSVNFGLPIVLLAGFDINESHLVEEDVDYGDPTTTARDVVDRESLKAFVTEAGEWFLAFQKTGDFAGAWKARIALRDPNGPWRHGSVYLYVLDLTSNFVLFHGAFPNRFELRPLVAIARDGVTGELILPQVLAAAKNDPEGGFVEYYYDDPDDDSDSADIPKVGYARQFTGELSIGGRVVPFNFIVGSGYYGRAPDVAATHARTEVAATVTGDAVEGLTVEFSRAIAGRPSSYDWSAVTNASGSLVLTISSADGVSGYYRARARSSAGDAVGQWHSIPLNRNQRQVLELTLGGGMKVVRVEPLAAGKLAIAADSLVAPEAEAAFSGLSPGSPNPFNSATHVVYHLAEPGRVQLVIYNVLGQPVRRLVDESQAAGAYRVRWDARDQSGASLSTGIYIARLSYPGGVQTQRLLYLK